VGIPASPGLYPTSILVFTSTIPLKKAMMYPSTLETRKDHSTIVGV
jgi:hypothetical protein